MLRTLAERHITKLNVARRRPRSVTICTCEAVVPRELEVIGGAYPHGGRTLSLREGASSRTHRGATAAGTHRKASRAKADCSCLSFPAQTRVRRPPMVRKSRERKKRRTLPCPHAGCNMHAHDKTGLVRCVFPCLLMQLITPTDARLVWEKATQGTHSPIHHLFPPAFSLVRYEWNMHATGAGGHGFVILLVGFRGGLAGFATRQRTLV